MIGASFEFDAAKNASNRLKHGIGLDQFTGFDGVPIVMRDDRTDYGEDRFSAFGLIHGQPYNVVFTPRGDRLRLISFRRAHREELQKHEG